MDSNLNPDQTPKKRMIDGMKARDLGPRRIDAPSARRLVEDAVEFAAGFDFRPHSDFRSAKLIFGDIDASAGQPLVEIGEGGSHFISPDRTKQKATALKS